MPRGRSLLAGLAEQVRAGAWNNDIAGLIVEALRIEKLLNID